MLICSCSGKEDSDSRHSRDAATKEVATPDTEHNVTEMTPVTVASEKEKLIVIDFFATWCGPCRQLSPFFEKWANTYKDEVRFVKVDVDAEQMTAEEFGIEAMPTVVILAPDSTEITRIVGFRPDEIQQSIESAIATR